MKLVDFYPLQSDDPYPRFGLLAGGRVMEIGESARGTLTDWIRNGSPNYEALQQLCEQLAEGADALELRGHKRRVFALEDVQLCSPLNTPVSLRDFYAFEDHVATANANRGREVPEQWYEIPVFYFSNPNEIYHPDSTVDYPPNSEKLDYELEIACVIGKAGRDIAEDEAEDHILGYMIYNDWSARDIQAQEMKVGLGPAKGKDFAQSFGPYLVTPDELADKHAGRPGVYDLTMTASVNGEERSRGNWNTLHYSFGQMIARASAGAMLYPGDVIGSGTVGTGCLLELTKGQGPYLKPGDTVSLTVERLGTLTHTVGE